MAYSKDLKDRALSFLRGGGAMTEAVKLFKVHRNTLYEWKGQPPDHKRGKPGPKGSRKFNRDDLRKLVEEQPDLMQKEMAEMLGVSNNAICHALACMGIKRKKNAAIRTGLYGPRLRAAKTLSFAPLAREESSFTDRVSG